LFFLLRSEEGAKWANGRENPLIYLFEGEKAPPFCFERTKISTLFFQGEKPIFFEGLSKKPPFSKEK
jgi:hypothetical protein